ncbi:MAG: hypothetical protein M1827_007378 [Pycnora praestabilis]|nr:MAG: hypothetical protein M1827_007378 [Pycnora praestabilis]
MSPRIDHLRSAYFLVYSLYMACVPISAAPIPDAMSLRTNSTHEIPQSHKSAHTGAQRAGFVSLFFVLLAITALLSGILLGVMGLDLTYLRVLASSGAEEQQKQAKKILAVRKYPNWSLFSLILTTTAITQTLPLLLNPLWPESPLCPIIFSTLGVAFLGDFLPQTLMPRHVLSMAEVLMPLVWVCMYVAAVPATVPVGVSWLCRMGMWGKDIGTGVEMGWKRGILGTRALAEFVKCHERSQGNGGEVSHEAGRFIKAAFRMQGMKVKDVMVPWNCIAKVECDQLLSREFVRDVKGWGFGRLVVVEKRLGKSERVVGWLDVKVGGHFYRFLMGEAWADKARAVVVPVIAISDLSLQTISPREVESPPSDTGHVSRATREYLETRTKSANGLIAEQFVWTDALLAELKAGGSGNEIPGGRNGGVKIPSEARKTPTGFVTVRDIVSALLLRTEEEREEEDEMYWVSGAYNDKKNEKDGVGKGCQDSPWRANLLKVQKRPFSHNNERNDDCSPTNPLPLAPATSQSILSPPVDAIRHVTLVRGGNPDHTRRSHVASTSHVREGSPFDLEGFEEIGAILRHANTRSSNEVGVEEGVVEEGEGKFGGSWDRRGGGGRDDSAAVRGGDVRKRTPYASEHPPVGVAVPNNATTAPFPQSHANEPMNIEATASISSPLCKKFPFPTPTTTWPLFSRPPVSAPSLWRRQYSNSFDQITKRRAEEMEDDLEKGGRTMVVSEDGVLGGDLGIWAAKGEGGETGLGGKRLRRRWRSCL